MMDSSTTSMGKRLLLDVGVVAVIASALYVKYKRSHSNVGKTTSCLYCIITMRCFLEGPEADSEERFRVGRLHLVIDN